MDVIANAMTRDRFESITASLHFENENFGNADSSRTKKFQPIIDRFNEVFLDVLPFEEHLSIDEQIIAYKGKKSGLRQYNHLGRYRISTHVRNRAYLKIFFNFVHIVATNCWIQYRRDSEAQPKSEILDLYSFKANLADSLCRQNKVARVPRSGPPPKRPRPGRKSGLPPSDIRLDQLGHWPIGVGSEHRGQNCKLPGCKAKPVTKCEKCNVTLCISAKNCFKIFHTLDRI